LVFAGRLDEAAAVAEEMSAAADAAGDVHLRVAALVSRVLIAAYQDLPEEVDRLLGQVAASGASAPSDLSWIAFAQGESRLDRDPDGAIVDLDRAVQLADEVGNRYV